MHTPDTINKFLELRSQGWSLVHISEKTNVSTRTLLEWSHKYKAEIKSLRALELEALQEKILFTREEELELIFRTLKNAEVALAKRNLEFVDVRDLVRITSQLRAEIEKRRVNLEDLPEPPDSATP